MNSNYIIHLEHKSIFVVKGKEKNSFLQNIISNDINKVNRNNTIYSLLLSPQGKFLYDFNILLYLKDSFLIQCNQNIIDEFINKLNLYKLRSDISIKKIDNEFNSCFLNINNDKLFSTTKKIKGSTIINEFGYFFNDTRNSEFGIQGIIKKKKIKELTNKLELSILNLTTYKKLCHNLGFLDFISNNNLNQIFSLELNLKELNAIDFKKGCFVGQENTARMNLKKKIRRRIFPLQLMEGLLINNESIKINNKDIGKVIINENYNFALMKIENIENFLNQTIELQKSKIKIIKPFWLNL